MGIMFSYQNRPYNFKNTNNILSWWLFRHTAACSPPHILFTLYINKINIDYKNNDKKTSQMPSFLLYNLLNKQENVSEIEHLDGGSVKRKLSNKLALSGTTGGL